MFGIAAAVAAIAGYFIARYLKGSITISLPGTAFNQGDTVEGSFELLTRKEVKGNGLTACLVASETTREYRNGKSHSHTREIYRSGQTLENAKEYPAGYKAAYNFKLAVPAEQGAGGSVLGQALNMLGGLNRRISWKVEVRLDAEGVDLASSQKISVGQTGFFS